jgi:magnesium-protoporphyrin IX monomethyl ester (oxidative) cyclase
MYEAGLIRASFAIESGNEYIRNKIMGKHVKTEKIYEVVELAHAYKNLFTIAFFITGMPEDTVETLNDTYLMIEQLKFKINKFYINDVIPFPGTELFKQCVRDNLFTKKMDLNNIWKTPVDWKEYRQNKNIDQFYIKPYNMSLEQLLEFKEKIDKYDKYN